ncbi:MAG: hypothetical protein ACOC5T_01685 [Elusimicrobiota bacterium]
MATIKKIDDETVETTEEHKIKEKKEQLGKQKERHQKKIDEIDEKLSYLE